MMTDVGMMRAVSEQQALPTEKESALLQQLQKAEAAMAKSKKAFLVFLEQKEKVEAQQTLGVVMTFWKKAKEVAVPKLFKKTDTEEKGESVLLAWAASRQDALVQASCIEGQEGAEQLKRLHNDYDEVNNPDPVDSKRFEAAWMKKDSDAVEKLEKEARECKGEAMEIPTRNKADIEEQKREMVNFNFDAAFEAAVSVRSASVKKVTDATESIEKLVSEDDTIVLGNDAAIEEHLEHLRNSNNSSDLEALEAFQRMHSNGERVEEVQRYRMTHREKVIQNVGYDLINHKESWAAVNQASTSYAIVDNHSLRLQKLNKMSENHKAEAEAIVANLAGSRRTNTEKKQELDTLILKYDEDLLKHEGLVQNAIKGLNLLVREHENLYARSQVAVKQRDDLEARINEDGNREAAASQAKKTLKEACLNLHRVAVNKVPIVDERGVPAKTSWVEQVYPVQRELEKNIQLVLQMNDALKADQEKEMKSLDSAKLKLLARREQLQGVKSKAAERGDIKDKLAALQKKIDVCAESLDRTNKLRHAASERLNELTNLRGVGKAVNEAAAKEGLDQVVNDCYKAELLDGFWDETEPDSGPSGQLALIKDAPSALAVQDASSQAAQAEVAQLKAKMKMQEESNAKMAEELAFRRQQAEELAVLKAQAQEESWETGSLRSSVSIPTENSSIQMEDGLPTP